MANFSTISAERLALAHPDIQRVMNEAIKDFDFSVLCSFRCEADQNAACAAGKSHAMWGQSAHNFEPSLAVDCAPHPLDWEDITAFTQMAAIILSHATALGIKMTWGGSWKTLKDYPHFELTDWKTMRGPC